MKRFWKDVTVAQREKAWSIELDGRPVRTPAKALLLLPTQRIAEAVADEWRGVGEKLDPRAMPLTGLANAAIDRVGADGEEFARGLAAYGETDLLCYRADGPPALVARQAEHWDRLLAWARRRFDLDFVVTSGITHVPQPAATTARLSHAVAALDAFHLAGLSPLVTIGGSLVAGLAVLEGGAGIEEAWEAVSLDDRWQLEQWGEDQEARERLESRQREFVAASRFLQLLD